MISILEGGAPNLLSKAWPSRSLVRPSPAVVGQQFVDPIGQCWRLHCTEGWRRRPHNDHFPGETVLSLAIRALSPAAFAVLALTASTSLFAAPPSYEIEILRNLGNAPGQRSYAHGMSTVTGVPFGRSITSRENRFSAVAWDGSKPVKLAAVGKKSTEALGMAPSAEWLVGFSGNAHEQAVAWNWVGTAEPILLKSLEKGSWAYANGVNDSGFVVGSARKPSEGVIVAVVWQLPGTKAFELARPPGTLSVVASDVNNAGVIVGSASSNVGHAVKWTSRTAAPQVLQHLGGNSTAVAINSSGVVAGLANRPDNPQFAVKWESDGTLVELAPIGPPGATAYVTAINDSGDIVGSVDNKGVLWQDGAAYDLLSLLTPDARAIVDLIEIANGIDNAGRIVVHSRSNLDGMYRPAVLRPVK
jgi:hypothetical protein